jgi:thiosulfate/3-mercaptopyruvate sulfurtransferase
MKTPLVTIGWLTKHIEDDNLIILDASSEKSLETSSTIIPGARWFDISSAFSNLDSTYPNTFPTVSQFEENIRDLGVNKDSFMVIYDNKGIYTSPRVWWMLKAMGHQEVYVLDGGLPEWLNASNPTLEMDPAGTFSKGNFEANLDKGNVKVIDEIIGHAMKPKAILIDARSEGRFNGTAPEPREGLRSGSIPNSINIPYTDVLDGNKYKTPKKLKSVFNEVAPNVDLIFSCGSGITACIILLAAELILDNKKTVYDGSWTEWASVTEDVG